jgi:hypothetical protein
MNRTCNETLKKNTIKKSYSSSFAFFLKWIIMNIFLSLDVRAETQKLIIFYMKQLKENIKYSSIT